MTTEQALATTPTALTIAKPSILLVDDRPENLAALEAILEDLDVRLVRANSGIEALRHLLNEDFALILLDVQMPELDGYDTARLVRERTKTAHVPIIFLSAIDRDEHHALRGYGLGAVDFLPKPLNPYVLKAKASVFIELYAMRERLAQQAEALRASEARRIRRVRHAMLRPTSARPSPARAPPRSCTSAAPTPWWPTSTRPSRCSGRSTKQRACSSFRPARACSPPSTSGTRAYPSASSRLA
jgi:CheY-like chemotaxis protein